LFIAAGVPARGRAVCRSAARLKVRGALFGSKAAGRAGLCSLFSDYGRQKPQALRGEEPAAGEVKAESRLSGGKSGAATGRALL